MNFGPLEFVAYLRHKEARRREPAAVEAARAAAPVPLPEHNRLTVVSGPRQMRHSARGAALDTVAVFEAIAGPLADAGAGQTVRVRMTSAAGPLVLVLSSHQAVRWSLEPAPRVMLVAVLLAGRGESTVEGAGAVPVISIGGFYAFRRGSQEFRHLENEVLRATGCTIHGFQRARAGNGEIEVVGD